MATSVHVGGEHYLVDLTARQFGADPDYPEEAPAVEVPVPLVWDQGVGPGYHMGETIAWEERNPGEQGFPESSNYWNYI